MHQCIDEKHEINSDGSHVQEEELQGVLEMYPHTCWEAERVVQVGWEEDKGGAAQGALQGRLGPYLGYALVLGAAVLT